jgi:hypothetical protein
VEGKVRKQLAIRDAGWEVLDRPRPEFHERVDEVLNGEPADPALARPAALEELK